MDDDTPKPRKRKRKRPIYKRAWLYVVLGIAIVFVICVGPWPLYYSHYDGTAYARRTFERIGGLDFSSPSGSLSAAAGRVEITPPVGEPMGGFSARDPMTSDGVLDKLYARAITLSAGGKTVTIVGGDILLILPELRDAILDRVKLQREEVYFTASHTHSGPGGYSSRWIDRISLGAYDEKILDRLADQFAEAIVKSRSSLEPVRLSVRTITPSSRTKKLFVRNRLSPGDEAHGTVYVLSALPIIQSRPSASVATLVVASPHPTTLGRKNRYYSSDYPGVVQRKFESSGDTVCLFAAGAVGSMSPAELVPRGEQRRRSVGNVVGRLAGLAIDRKAPSTGSSDVAAKIGRWDSNQVRLSSFVLDVNLSPQQYLLGEYLRLSPLITSYLHNRRTYIHVLRIGDTVLFGMPCDYSGELAAELEKWASSRGLVSIVTSFNGDYIGYLVPQRRYRQPNYETRDLNLFGPWCGEYFNDICRRILMRLDANFPAPAPENQ